MVVPSSLPHLVDCSFHKTMVRSFGIISSMEEDDAFGFLGQPRLEIRSCYPEPLPSVSFSKIESDSGTIMTASQS